MSETVVIRPWREGDIPTLVEVHNAAYGEYEPAENWDARQFYLQLKAFPEGQLLAEVDGQIAGYATSLIVQLDAEPWWYKEDEITGGGTFSTHDPTGDTLFGADIAVHPDLRGRGLAGRLYQGRKALVRRYNLRRMIAYGRIPGYAEHAGRLTADEYVERVVAGELGDPALNAHLKAGYRVARVMLGYMVDRTSLDHCTLLEYENPDFDLTRRSIASPVLHKAARRMRVCVAQYQMRPISGWEELEANVEFFATTADEYHCHFLVLPEYFTGQFLSSLPLEAYGDRELARAVADMHGRYVAMFRTLAMRYRLYIVGGSTPIRRDDDKLYNVAHLFTPDGEVFTQDKLHITPSERKEWDVQPGEGIRVFDTPHGRIAILVCYDIEFPELARLVTLAGAEVIFVPFATDDKKAYYRVRYSAQARAVENYVYTVIAGNCGNLPGIRTYLLNYAQSAVFTPSDLAFPIYATLGEADPNVESVVVADLDFTTLAQQRELGSVRPLYDRRLDLYGLRARVPVEVVRTDRAGLHAHEPPPVADGGGSSTG